MDLFLTIQKFGYRKNLVDYRIIYNSANFSSSLKNFQVQLYVSKIRDYASLNEINVNTTSSFLIKDVLNTTTLILDTPFTYNNKVATITSGNYKIVYNGFPLPESAIGINNTTQLDKLLAITSGDLVLDYVKESKIITKLLIADEQFNLNISLA